MITGFNTDIERDGVVYHVQTEDKGLNSPLILSLVYSGGEILAAKRTPYEDLIAEGFTDEALAERLKRQHRLICAAINAGRIEELKQMGARKGVEPPSPSPPAAAPETKDFETPPRPAVEEEFIIETSAARETHDLARPPQPAVEKEFIIETSAARSDLEWKPPVKIAPASSPPPDAVERQSFDEFTPSVPATTSVPISSTTKKSAYTVHDSRRPSRPKKNAQRAESVVLSLLDDEEFFAGQSTNLRVLLQSRAEKDEKPIGGVMLSIKVLGATFRPQIYSVKTQRDGVAVVSIDFPTFSSGRAAVVIRAEAQGETVELRRVIHPAG